MPNFNPSTGVSGMEWYPSRKLPTALGSSASLLGVKALAAASETISSIHPRIASEASVPFLVDVYDLASPIVDPEVWALGMPISNRQNAPGWAKSISGVESAYDANAFAMIDDPCSLNFPTSIGASDQLFYIGGYSGVDDGQIMFNTTWANGFINGDTGDPGLVVDSKRCLCVSVWAIVENMQTFGGVRFDGQLSWAGSRYGSQSGPVLLPLGTGLTRVRFDFDRNPATGQQWTQGDIQQFVLLQEGFGIRIVDKVQAGYFVVTAMNIGFRTTTERRVTSGYGFTPSTGGAWCQVNCEDPVNGTTANWAKTAGHTYLYVFSLINGNASLVGVDSANLSGHTTDKLAGWEGATAPASRYHPTANPTYSPWVPGLFMKQASTAISVDSQPYVTPVLAELSNGQSDHQVLGTHLSTDYGSIRITVAAMPGEIPDGALYVGLHLTVGGAQVGGTATIMPADVPADGMLHLMNVALDLNATLAAATGYYLQFATSSTKRWYIGGCYTGSEITPTADDTFAGGATVSGVGTRGGIQIASLDWLTAIATAPIPPAVIVATVGTFALSPAPPGGPASVSYAVLDWTSTTLGAAFAYYELQRQDGGIYSGTYRTIAYITNEANSIFNDFETPRGVLTRWQVRVVRTDGAFSSWRGMIGITLPQGGACDVILTTNANTGLTRAYQDAAPHAYARANAADTTTQLIEGRQAPIVFRPLIEGNSDVFSRTFLVAMDDVVAKLTTIDRSVFTPLIALMEAPVPYVRVIQGNGDAWYASGRIASAAFSQPGNAHKCQVDFTEVAFIPAAVVV